MTNWGGGGAAASDSSRLVTRTIRGTDAPRA